MKQYIQELEQLGLSEKESAVYLALLELGSATVAEIAEDAGIKRPTAYFVIEDLIKKGIVSAAGGTVKHYIAEKPQKILTLQKSKLAQFEKVLPGLIELSQNQKQKPTVRMFTGTAGIRAVYEESLLQARRSEILSLGNAQAVEESLPGFGEWYIERRVKAGIRMRALVTDTPYHQQIVKRDTQELRNTLLIKEELFTQDLEMNLYGSTVAMMSFEKGEFVGILIESSVFAAGYKQLFELLWKLANKK